MDARLAIWVATHRFAPANDVFVWLGNIDRIGAVWVVLMALVCVVQRRRLVAALVLVAATAVATFAADSASFGVKDLTNRARPFEAHRQIHPLYVVHSSSFPAGHAATAAAGAVLLSYAWRRGLPLFAALALAIAYSRIYVGVHYPTDVLAGAVLGLACGGVVVLLLAWSRLASRGWTRPLRSPGSSPSSTTS